MVPEPSVLALVAGLALAVTLLGALVIRRRRATAAVTSAAPAAPEPPAVTSPPRPVVELVVDAAIEPDPAPDPTPDTDAGPAVEAGARLPGLSEEPVFAPLPEVEPLVPTPTAPAAPAPQAPGREADGSHDPVSRAYVDLSHELAARGRWHDAALAQWAADLHTLGPLLQGDSDRLSEGLRLLTPLDAASAVTGARALAASLLGPAAPRHMSRLADASHLTGAVGAMPGPTPTTASGVGDVTDRELPDDVLRALQTVLQGAADTAGDARGRSVGLRCDVVAHLLLTHDAHGGAPDRRRAESVARQVLEPHERPLLDRALAARAS